MKKHIFLAAAIISCVSLLSGCKGFLDEEDKDKFLPTDVDHYASLLLREFNYNYPTFYWTSFMTDELEDRDDIAVLTSESSTRVQAYSFIAWQRDLEINIKTEARYDFSKFWLNYYRIVAIANYCIERIPEATGTQADKDYAMAEAYFARAYCFFTLANLYATPYRDAQQASEALGIPLRVGTDAQITYEKNKLDETYKRILEDVNTALNLMTQSGKKPSSIFHPSIDAIKVFLSRVHLFMGDYNAVIADLEDVIRNNSLSTVLNGHDNAYITESNPDVLYSFSLNGGGLLTNSYQNNIGFKVSKALLDLYEENDCRLGNWFDETLNSRSNVASPFCRKGDTWATNMGKVNIRLAEAYLNRAEAYARTGKASQAADDLKTLTKTRHGGVADSRIPSSEKQLIQFVMDERFREFCFEDNFRWFDLRRLPIAERKELVHSISRYQGSAIDRVEVYHLFVDDPNYTLSIPFKEKEINGFIFDWERYDKLSD